MENTFLDTLTQEWGETRPAIVMISGHAGVGKTTFAQLLGEVVKEDNPDMIIMTMPIALGVKSVASTMGWDGQKDVAGRRLLQSVGQVGRAYNPDVWIAKAWKGIEDTNYHFQGRLKYAFIDDWRFKNEVTFIKEHNNLARRIYTVRIVAPSREILAGTPEALDISEVELDDYEDFDILIDNEGSLETLKMSARLVVNNVFEKTEV